MATELRTTVMLTEPDDWTDEELAFIRDQWMDRGFGYSTPEQADRRLASRDGPRWLAFWVMDDA